MAFEPVNGFFDLSADSDTYAVPPDSLTIAPSGVRALDGNDAIVGSAIADLIYGNGDRDTLSGAAGNDLLFGGRDGDSLNGGSGNDFVAGNRGSDILQGGDGNDLLVGGRGGDLLFGGSGHDFLSGDLGLDGLIGGDGSDVFVLRGDAVGPDDGDLILDYQTGIDRIQLSGGLTLADLQVSDRSLAFSDAIALLAPQLSNLDNALLGSIGLSSFNLELLTVLSDAQLRAISTNLLGVDLDPDGDGQVVGAVASLINGPDLAIYIGLSASDFSQQII